MQVFDERFDLSLNKVKELIRDERYSKDISFRSLRNKIYEITNPHLFFPLVVKKGPSSFKRETEINLKLQTISNNKLIFPMPIVTIDEDKEHYYVMQKVDGNLGTDIIEQSGTLSTEHRVTFLESIIKIYNLFRHDSLRKSRYKEIWTGHKFPVQVQQGLEPIVQSIFQSPYQSLFNDSGADNIIITEDDKLCILDTEEIARTPLSLDIAFFLNYPEQGDLTSKLDYVRRSVDAINKNANTQFSEKTLISEYCNSVIYMSTILIPSMAKRNRLKRLESLKNNYEQTIRYMFKNNIVSVEKYSFLSDIFT